MYGSGDRHKPATIITSHLTSYISKANSIRVPITMPLDIETQPKQNGWFIIRIMWWSWNEQSGWWAPQRYFENSLKNLASPAGWDNHGTYPTLKTSRRLSSFEQHATWLSCCIQTNVRPAAACWFIMFWILSASYVDSQHPFFIATTSYLCVGAIEATPGCMLPITRLS